MAKVAVAGAGPAGIAAAIAAAEAGANVTLIDDNPSPGGQIWRAMHGKLPHQRVQKLYHRLSELAVTQMLGCTVIDGMAGSLQVDNEASVETIQFDATVLCTGARELFLPFPGWTLPGIMGAGGAQALLKGGANFDGKRVVVSGSAPLLLAVGASFVATGAEVIGVFEQASLAALARFGLKAFHPSRLIEAGGYIAGLGTTPYVTGTWVCAALGNGQLEAVKLTDGDRTWTEPCDLLACGFGLVPNTELAQLMGCETTHDSLQVNADQQTSVAGVYAAGEPLGIGGLDLALAEGTVAGCAAAGKENPAATAKVAKLKPFRQLLRRSFQLRPELLKLAWAETMVCRCEDVPLGAIDPTWTARQAKLYTRIGMGPCQGRVCGPATRCLFGWTADRPRSPLYPTKVNHLAADIS